jgi:hypothetical protein
MTTGAGSLTRTVSLSQMKRLATIIASFLLGAILASAGWALYFFKQRADLAVFIAVDAHGHAELGTQILTYLESPNPLIARRLSFFASNSIAGFSPRMDDLDREFPYVQARRRYSAESKRFDAFMRERQARLSTNTLAEGKN